MAKLIPVDTQKHHGVILCRVDEMRSEKKHCDFLIKVGSKEIPVHRNILCATSDYFDAMFSHPTRENESGVVEMIGVDPECAMICVNHMYGKEVSILPEKYEPLMYAANLMQLHTLRDAIESLVEADLDPKSFFMVKRIANMYECKKLEEKSKHFSDENLELISRQEEFGKQDKDWIKQMLENTSATERQKLSALLNWIRFDSQRTVALSKMLRSIDLSRIPVEYRRYLLEEDPMFYESFELFRLLSFSVMDAQKIVPKNLGTLECVNEIVVFDSQSGHLQCWNPGENTWTQMQKLNTDMKNLHFSAVTVENRIFVLMANRRVYRLNYSDETTDWERMTDMIDEHGYFPPAVAHSGDIYVIGGHLNLVTAAVEKYEVASNQWTKLADKSQPSQFTEMLSSQGFIYSFGGFIDEQHTGRVQRYDPKSNTWVEIASMHEPKGCMGVVEMHSKIFVIGGSLPGTFGTETVRVRSVECYNPVLDTWTSLKPMATVRSHLRAYRTGGIIHAVGGYNSSPDSIEKYDLERNEWELVDLPRGMILHILESVEIRTTV